MAHDASQLLGSPQLAGVIVSARGAGIKAAAGTNTGIAAAGAAGAVASAIVNATFRGKANKNAAQAAVSTAPELGRWAFLAVTDDELALGDLVSKRSGRLALGDVIARIPRAEVASGEVGSARTAFPLPLTISFSAGDTWLLEAPRWARKQAGKVVGLLAGEERGI